jgi:multidrug efflux pump
MSRFFIDRPVFAWVLAIVLMLAGGVAVFTLPIAQYPSIAPPAVSISATYPGASAETVQSTVAQPIEQQLSGLDHLLYFSTDSYKLESAEFSASLLRLVTCAHSRRARVR